MKVISIIPDSDIKVQDSLTCEKEYTLLVTNTHPDLSVFVKIKTNTPKNCTVTPNCYLLSVNESINIIITLLSKPEFKDIKFLIRALPIPKDVKNKKSLKNIFSLQHDPLEHIKHFFKKMEEKKITFDKKIRVILPDENPPPYTA